MAVAETLTKMPPSRWARLMGIHPLHFEGVFLQNVPPSVCAQPWMQFEWQAVDRVSREEVARAIAQAEADIERELGYHLLPAWDVDEWHKAARSPRPEWSRQVSVDVRKQAQTVQAKWGYLLSGGIRQKDLAEAAAAIAWSDTDGDGYTETGTVTVAVTAGTPESEMHVYYPGESGADAWEIRPVAVSIAGAVATITFRRELCVIKAQLEIIAVPADDSHIRGLDGALDANFLTTVDVYRAYNDPQALRDGTPVLTPLGWVPIEELRPGDAVIGRSGRKAQVRGVFPQGKRPLFRVTFDDGTTIDCDSRHRWAVLERDRARSQVLTTEQLLDRGLKTASGHPRFHIPLVEPVEFGLIEPLPLSPYTLGALIGDGNLGKTFVSLCSQREVASVAALPVGHSWRERGDCSQDGSVARFDAVGSEWHRNDVLSTLRHLGLAGKRSWEKFIPRSYLWASIAARRELLRGLLDTDGRITKLGSARYFTTSPMLAQDVAFLVRSLGGLVRVRLDQGQQRKYEYGGETRYGRPLYELTIRFNGQWCPFTLPFKAERWMASRRTPRRSIVSIEAAGSDFCTCIAVDAQDQLYVTKDFAVTHNTQATFLWEPFGTGACASCNGTGCNICAYSAQTGCLMLRDEPRLSIVSYRPATWDQAALDFAEAAWTVDRQPDLVRLYYYSGWQDKNLAYPTIQMDRAWERAVAYYAASLLDRPVCECNNVHAWVESWRRDLAIAGEEGLRISAKDLDCPFGTKRGAVFAWKRVNTSAAIGRTALV